MSCHLSKEKFQIQVVIFIDACKRAQTITHKSPRSSRMSESCRLTTRTTATRISRQHHISSPRYSESWCWSQLKFSISNVSDNTTISYCSATEIGNIPSSPPPLTLSGQTLQVLTGVPMALFVFRSMTDTFYILLKPSFHDDAWPDLPPILAYALPPDQRKTARSGPHYSVAPFPRCLRTGNHDTSKHCTYS